MAAQPTLPRNGTIANLASATAGKSTVSSRLVHAEKNQMNETTTSTVRLNILLHLCNVGSLKQREKRCQTHALACHSPEHFDCEDHVDS